ncbi:MAG: hypothetical protein DMD37_05080 [Gemmatimonadetes bacterium]|nr:MAG: hypothetical protein DMD71_03265 [Gemmatimonadota bacterium]PYP63761.1 MAG: hypothetical protein DMD37_05080 [Gemmatimonadota bacterium]
MSAFRYQAARDDGALVRGVIESTSTSDAAAVLSARGLYPVSVEESPTPDTWHLSPRISAQHLATVFQSLASLVEAGVPLEKALRATQPLATGKLGEALERVGARVREGASLGTALAQEHGLFSGVTVGLVRAGERGVGLDRALQQAALQLEREAETVAKLRAALAYPMLLAVVGTISAGVIMLFVVPRFVALLSDLGQALPVATRILIGVSATARRFGLVIGAGACIGTVAGTRLIAARRAVWHGWLLSLPVVGPIRHALATARACRTLSALLGTGTPALAALQIARDAAGDEAVGARLDAARSPVAEGGALSNALEATGAMTPGALQLARIGEGSGRLAPLLAKAAELEEREAERRLKTLVTFVEPALILMFAALVAFVAAALLQAVYSLRPG